MHVTFTIFIFRVAVVIKVLLVIRDLREAREIREIKVHQDQEEKEYVTFVVIQQSTHCPRRNGLGIAFQIYTTIMVCRVLIKYQPPAKKSVII